MNIHVGNLARETSEPQLRDSYAKFGEGSRVRIVLDKLDGRPKGFGFVEMPTQEHAQAAIAGLNGTDMGGKIMEVSEARSNGARPANATGTAAVPLPEKQ
ncbi:MAG: RNA-binding protein [candidate division Zixibacteria bacterium]|nr:RNA-binding protein [candidate division Zixibacteria bacterium]